MNYRPHKVGSNDERFIDHDPLSPKHAIPISHADFIIDLDYTHCIWRYDGGPYRWILTCIGWVKTEVGKPHTQKQSLDPYPRIRYMPNMPLCQPWYPNPPVDIDRGLFRLYTLGYQELIIHVLIQTDGRNDWKADRDRWI